MLTPEQVIVTKAAFDSVFRSCGTYDLEVIGTDHSKAILHMTADYVGYLAWRAVRSHRRYRNKEMNVRRHLATFYKADYALAALIHLMGMDELRTTSPQTLRIIKRFLEHDSL